MSGKPKSVAQHLDVIDTFTGVFSSLPPENEDREDNKHLDKIFDLIYSADNIELKTDLTPPLILAITKMQMYSEFYKIPVAEQIVQKFMKLCLSKNRQSRKEFTEISRSATQQELQDTDRGILARLKGGNV